MNGNQSHQAHYLSSARSFRGTFASHRNAKQRPYQQQWRISDMGVNLENFQILRIEDGIYPQVAKVGIMRQGRGGCARGCRVTVPLDPKDPQDPQAHNLFDSPTTTTTIERSSKAMACQA